MTSKYFKAVPTLIVFAFTGYAAWPILFREPEPAASVESTKPPPESNLAGSAEPASLRSPFQIIQARPEAKAMASSKSKARTETETEAEAETGTGTKTRAGARKPDLAVASAEDDDTLAGMRLVGTMMNGRQRIAMIDDNLYAAGEPLKAADGSVLPYVVREIYPHRAVIRRGKRDFVLAFSDKPNPNDGFNEPPIKLKGVESGTTAEAKPKPAARPKKGDASKVAKGSKPGPSADDEATLNALSNLSSLASKVGTSPNAQPDTGVAEEAKSAIMKMLPGNPNALSAGLDALMGKYDNLGNGVATPGGGTP